MTGEQALMQEPNYELTALHRRTIIDLRFQLFMVRPRPFVLLPNYSRRHLGAGYLKSLVWGSTESNFPIMWCQVNVCWSKQKQMWPLLLLPSSTISFCFSFSFFFFRWWDSRGPLFLFLPLVPESTELNFLLQWLYPHSWYNISCFSVTSFQSLVGNAHLHCI